MPSRFTILAARDAKVRVGLFGGSFNPPHAGHMHLAKKALKRLELDKVVWLVSPQNPLKGLGLRQSFSTRHAAVQKFACHPRMIVSDIEGYQRHTYTAATIARLQKMHPKTEFVWLMGADNLPAFHKWHRWKSILAAVPICVFDRIIEKVVNIYSAAKSKTLKFGTSSVVTRNHKGMLAPKHITIMRTRRVYLSSTALRALAGRE